MPSHENKFNEPDILRQETAKKLMKGMGDPDQELKSAYKSLLEQEAKRKGKTISNIIPFWRKDESEEPIEIDGRDVFAGMKRLFNVWYEDDPKGDPEMVSIDFDFLRELPIENLGEYLEELLKIINEVDTDLEWYKNTAANALVLSMNEVYAIHNASVKERALARLRSQEK